MRRLYGLFGVAMLLLAAGCARTSENYQTRPFFLLEQDTATHGRKSWFDRLIETDPGTTDYHVAADYQERPPRQIAVLPFVDHGNGEYKLDKISLSFRNNHDDLDRMAWTHANRMRRTVNGEIGGREFEMVPSVAVDAVLADRGVNDWNKLMSMPPQKLGRWLGADAVLYGEILDYEAYWAGLVSAWRVSARIRMVSTSDGHEIFTAESHRYSVDLAPALDPIDIGINSILTLIDLRDIRLARAECEVGRELIMRLPTAQGNVWTLAKDAVEKERSGIFEGGASDDPPHVEHTNIQSAHNP